MEINEMPWKDQDSYDETKKQILALLTTKNISVGQALLLFRGIIRDITDYNLIRM